MSFLGEQTVRTIKQEAMKSKGGMFSGHGRQYAEILDKLLTALQPSYVLVNETSKLMLQYYKLIISARNITRKAADTGNYKKMEEVEKELEAALELKRVIEQKLNELFSKISIADHCEIKY